MEQKLIQEAREFLRGVKEPHITSERLRRRLDWKLAIAIDVMNHLVTEGVLGPRERAGYPILIQRVPERSALAPVEPIAVPAAEVTENSNSLSDSRADEHQPVEQHESAPAARQPLFVALKRITRDPSIQPRAGLDQDVVTAYEDLMMAGVKMPPVTLYDPGDDQLILADGSHRVAAAEEIGLKEIPATVIKGSRRDATLFAIEANVSHGKLLTNEEKRKAALRLLGDEEWGNWSDAEIARRCGFSAAHVGRLRRDHPNNVRVTRKCRGKNGAVRVMRTGKIGKRDRSSASKGTSVQADASATAAVSNVPQKTDAADGATIEHSVSLLTEGAASLLSVPEPAHSASLRELDPRSLTELHDLLSQVLNLLPTLMRAAA